MDSTKLGSGDTKAAPTITLKYVDQRKSEVHLLTFSDLKDEDERKSPISENQQQEEENEKIGHTEITPEMIDDNEAKLKERIAQCRNIIESLKVELNEEKSKLENQSKIAKPHPVERPAKCQSTSQYVSTSGTFLEDISYTSGIYSECVHSKLNCDENLIEYEKQLQKYQNTLNMAQIEKKNAIRKQMLAKAYRLKLLEVENQCNIELLRVKQNLQCLEPLQLIANKWKTNTDEIYDINTYELIPRYPELNENSNCDFSDCRDALDIKEPLEYGDVSKNDCVGE